MDRYAFLCGSAPDGFRQKKLAQQYDFLMGRPSGCIPGRNVFIFPNGVSEIALEMLLTSIMAGRQADEFYLSFCTLSPAAEDAAVVSLGEYEIRREVISYFADELARKLDVGFHVQYDHCDELVEEDSLGWERVG